MKKYFKMGIGGVCIFIAIYVVSELGLFDVWEDAMCLRKISLFIGAIVAISLGGLMALRTLKKKGYVNLLWVALPVPILTGIDLLFQILLGTKHF